MFPLISWSYKYPLFLQEKYETFSTKCFSSQSLWIFILRNSWPFVNRAKPKFQCFWWNHYVLHPILRQLKSFASSFTSWNLRKNEPASNFFFFLNSVHLFGRNFTETFPQKPCIWQYIFQQKAFQTLSASASQVVVSFLAISKQQLTDQCSKRHHHTNSKTRSCYRELLLCMT